MQGIYNCLAIIFLLSLSLNASSQVPYIEVEVGDTCIFKWGRYEERKNPFPLESDCMVGTEYLLPPYVLKAQVEDGIYKIIRKEGLNKEHY